MIIIHQNCLIFIAYTTKNGMTALPNGEQYIACVVMRRRELIHGRDGE